MQFKCSGCKQVFPYEQRSKHKCEYQDVAELQRETKIYLSERFYKIEKDEKVEKNFA